MAEINWLDLWRRLVNRHTLSRNRERTNSYLARAGKKTGERPDPLLDFVRREIDGRSTVLDVGAGNGRWAIPLAGIAGKVTAVEPSEAVRDVLRRNIANAGLSNIEVVPASWEETAIEPHDVVVCAHAMYSTPEFAGFVNKMELYAGKRCYLALRFPPHDGIIGELSLAIYGERHDSPNAIIAYNALYSLGIYANVLVEEGIHQWIDSTLEGAFARAKKHLRLGSSTDYDGLIRDTLTRRLGGQGQPYVWPDGMRSALLWWDPRPRSE